MALTLAAHDNADLRRVLQQVGLEHRPDSVERSVGPDAWTASTFRELTTRMNSPLDRGNHERSATAADHLIAVAPVPHRLNPNEDIAATWQMKISAPQTQVVMLTIHEAAACRADSTATGASACVLKRRTYGELVPTVAALLSSEYRAPGVARNPA